VATKEPENGKLIGGMFATDSVKISYSADIYGIEYAGILKNIYALAAGLCSGLGYGDNFRAVLTSACAAEMTRYIQESYPFERSTLNSAYLGDLLVTSYSSFSRNRRLGQMIGRGCTVKSALNEMTMVAEGYFAAACIHHINEQHGISMPIADMVYDVLYRRANPRKRMKELTELL
jgi:glycerol-3-phosphate dehydrogenase (NAD(P)+)